MWSSYQGEGGSLPGIYQLRYEGKKRNIIDNNKNFSGYRRIAALLNKKEESEYIILTYYLYLL